MEGRSYTIGLITPQDKPEVIDFLTRFFFRDEPLNVETGMNLDYINGKRCPELEEYCTNFIPEGNSVKAVSPSGKIVGVCLNGGVHRGSPEDANDCPNEKFKKVLILIESCEKETDVFNKYPHLNKLLDIKIISVDTNWRGLGICKALFEETRKVALEQKFQMIKVDCTSQISARAAQRLGFERIHVLKYSEYLEEGSNQPVFNPPPPHFGVQIYVYPLDKV